ncbi:Hypothetical predicted protein [Pelobates cultripes]|uniref:Uncharacterized protein n=1 Tax=Pelobates cultripes TaxID=61616 RepID=A0AAD1VM43_PELCU|nr:Hypothetical predicted protein [Pelobates cultripes]CAH2220357.1 Hypothetical predicted protein [Pelobates cultripes]
MAAQCRHHERGAHNEPPTPPKGTFDWLCNTFWEALHSRGATYRQAELMVAAWIRPAARRSQYRRPPRASKATIRQCRYRRSPRRGGALGLARTLHCSPPHKPTTMPQKAHAGNPPDPTNTMQCSMIRIPAGDATKQRLERLLPPQGTTGADSRYGDITPGDPKAWTHIGTDRDFPTLGIG